MERHHHTYLNAGTDMSNRRIRKRKTKTTRGKKEYTIYSISIPEEIASRIPDDMVFKAELTEEGLLFRPILPKHAEKDVLPTWLAGKSI